MAKLQNSNIRGDFEDFFGRPKKFLHPDYVGRKKTVDKKLNNLPFLC